MLGSRRPQPMSAAVATVSRMTLKLVQVGSDVITATGPVSFALAMSEGAPDVGVAVDPSSPERVTNRVTPTEMAITSSTATAIKSHFTLLFWFGGGCGGPHPGGG